MAQGDFTKEEAENAIECVKTIYNCVPRKAASELLGEVNDLYLFLAAAKRTAPTEEQKVAKDAAKFARSEKSKKKGA